MVDVYDAEGKKRLHHISTGPVSKLAWSSDSNTIATGSDAIRFWDVASGQPRGVFVSLWDGNGLALSPDGHYRGTPAAAVEREIVYVVQTKDGTETLTPAEFAKRFGWKNDPDRVRVTEK